jgi:hypothetical protein
MNQRDLSKQDMDLTVWRYMPLSKFISLLTFQALWFSKLNILQDQFEGMMPAPTKEMMKKRYQEMKKNFPAVQHWQFDEMASRNEQDSRQLLVVSCWFLGESESSRMWKEYGGENDAVAIRSTVRQLLENIGVSKDPNATHMGRVKYIDHSTHMMSSYEANQGIERAFLKDLEKYGHEKELRIVTLNVRTRYCVKPDGEPYKELEVQGKDMNNFDEPGLYIAVRFKELVSEIVASPNSGGWLVLLLRRIMNLNNFNIPVTASKCSNT